MCFKLLVLVLLIQIVVARLTIDVNIDDDQKVNISHSGHEFSLATEDDFKLFKVGNGRFNRLVADYVKDKSFSNDITLSRINRITDIKSATVKSIKKQPIVVSSQDFENSSNHTIKVNTGISHSIANTLTTSWSREQQLTITQDIEYELNVGIFSAGGKTGYSFTTTGGVSEEKSITETIGTTSGMEVELKPGDAVTAVLSANAGYLEIEVEHYSYLSGEARNKEHKWSESIEWIMIIEGIRNDDITPQVTTTETIRFNFFVEAKLRVYEKKTGLLLL